MNLAITLLTGRRPFLLSRTLNSLKAHQSKVVDDALVIALHNGGDQHTTTVLNQHRDLVALVIQSEFLGIGAACSLLFRHAQELDAHYLLHLEDDWEASEGDWYDQAVDLLEAGVFQVRLRHQSEPTLARHMVTNHPIRWKQRDGYRVSNDAHYTLNPSLIRLSDLGKGWPAMSERHAQNQFWNHGRRRVAQVEGVWRHIGGEDSLRKRMAQ